MPRKKPDIDRVFHALGDPMRRANQLYNVCENFGLIEDESRWTRQTDRPTHLTPVRVHGGIGP